jgi:EpsI family protein
MARYKRIIICMALIAAGLGAEVAIQAACGLGRERPPLRRPLVSLPTKLGDWTGTDYPVSAAVLRESNADEYLSRVYVSPRFPGLHLKLWVNYSAFGFNLKHTPEVCLPAGGWAKREAETRVMEIPAEHGPLTRLTRLGYSQGELFEHIGYWYYIFGEGKLENYVRSLPITSQSSYGRATRGSSITIEVFYAGDRDPNGNGLRDFAGELIRHLDPILPEPRDAYFMP